MFKPCAPVVIVSNETLSSRLPGTLITMGKTIIILHFILSITSALADHSPFYSYKELSAIVGYRDIYEAQNQKKVLEEEAWALQSYVEYDDPIYPEINSYLRTGKAEELYYFTDVDDLKKTISNMDKGIKKLAKLPSNLMTFRGVTFGFRQNKCYEKNEVYLDKAFVSTSVKLGVAEAFAGVETEKLKGSGVLYLYTDSSKHPGILINQLEEEVLLPRGLTYKVMDRVDRNGSCQLLVQICNQTCSEEVENLTVQKTWNSLMKK